MQSLAPCTFREAGRERKVVQLVAGGMIEKLSARCSESSAQPRACCPTVASTQRASPGGPCRQSTTNARALDATVVQLQGHAGIARCHYQHRQSSAALYCPPRATAAPCSESAPRGIPERTEVVSRASALSVPWIDCRLRSGTLEVGRRQAIPCCAWPTVRGRPVSWPARSGRALNLRPCCGPRGRAKRVLHPPPVTAQPLTAGPLAGWPCRGSKQRNLTGTQTGLTLVLGCAPRAEGIARLDNNEDHQGLALHFATPSLHCTCSGAYSPVHLRMPMGREKSTHTTGRIVTELGS